MFQVIVINMDLQQVLVIWKYVRVPAGDQRLEGIQMYHILYEFFLKVGTNIYWNNFSQFTTYSNIHLIYDEFNRISFKRLKREDID